MRSKYDLDIIALELQSDGELYNKYSHYINKDYIYYYNIIRSKLNHLTITERQYISVSIWYYFGGTEDLIDSYHKNRYTIITQKSKCIQTFTQQYIESTKDTNMTINHTIPVQQITYVFGKDVNLMSEEELINAIKQVETEIEKLSSVKTESTKINLRISEHKETLQKLAKLLDNK